MEEILIDGCNLCYKAYGSAGDKERGRLIRSLKEYCLRKKICVTVVFDSREGTDISTPSPAIKVRYVPHPADNFIVERVRESPRKRSITVVTGDREIVGSIISLGAKILAPAEFFSRLLPRRAHDSREEVAGGKPLPPHPNDIRHYLEIWGED